MRKNRFRQTKRRQNIIQFLFVFGGFILVFILVKGSWGAFSYDPLDNTPLSLGQPTIHFEDFQPSLKQVENGKYTTRFENGVTVTYTLDHEIQTRIEDYFKRYKVPYGAFVAISPKTGKILALVDYSEREPIHENLALRASFPAASLFKVITAAAAIEEKHVSPDHPIAYRGKFNHLKPAFWEDNPKKDRLKMSFSDAFAKSNNVVFAKIANRWLDVPTLIDYGERFQFNQTIPFEHPVEISQMEIEAIEGGLEKTAAGFGKVGLSPLHAVLIGSAIANKGIMMNPCMIESVTGLNEEVLYECTPKILNHSVSQNTAKILRDMMGKTIRNGTVKDIFRKRHLEQSLRKINIGGKTGSLRGKTPPGRYTWFIGMAPLEDPEIVVAAMIVNDPVWHILAPQVAKEGLAAYFESHPRTIEVSPSGPPSP